MSAPASDRDTLRELARRVAEIAAEPVHDVKRDLWRRLNGLERTRPLVWINEIPWHEIPDVEPQCEDAFCRSLESSLRRTLHSWEHFRCDSVVDPFITCRTVIRDTGYGLEVSALRPEEFRGAKDYVPVIREEADIEKICMPQVTVDAEATERRYQQMCDLVGDVLPVQRIGIAHMWCAPWDVLIQWWGIEELYVDMLDRPGFVHKGIGRMMDALLCRLDQYEKLGVLSVSNGNHRVGSGGLGITDELPQPDYDGEHARTMDQWGTSTGQIFSEVSPDMHEEFCLQYERRWLERFGLNCYGCCEPLDRKMGILRSVPRLRRVSMSPWVDLDRAAAETGRDFIFSHKPNPAVLATERWNPDHARSVLRDALERTRACVVEVIMKDIETCRSEPHRIAEWCRLAVEVAEEFA